MRRANRWHTPLYVATNLLESMVVYNRPTIAEMNDIANTLLDGAHGLVLAAETAIGVDPVGAVDMVKQAVAVFEQEEFGRRLRRSPAIDLTDRNGGSGDGIAVNGGLGSTADSGAAALGGHLGWREPGREVEPLGQAPPLLRARDVPRLGLRRHLVLQPVRIQRWDVDDPMERDDRDVQLEANSATSSWASYRP